MCESAYRAKELIRPVEPENYIVDGNGLRQLQPGGFAGEHYTGWKMLLVWGGALVFCFLGWYVAALVVVRAAQGIWALLME